VDAVGRPSSPGGLQLTDSAAWLQRLRGADAIIHLAGRAHITNDRVSDPLRAFREVNVEGTRCIASAAVANGVRRFVFVSSIGVHGTQTFGSCITENSPILPHEPYARSKWEAEELLRQIGSESAMEWVVVRPALVYGPHAKGNFLRLMRLVGSGLPLPLAGIRNRRSFIGVANLCDLLYACTRVPAAAGRAFVAADGQDLSTPALLALIARSMRRPSRLVYCPPALLRLLMSMAGKRTEYQRLVGDLCVDASTAREVLGWVPRQQAEAGIAEMVRAYRGDNR
jgi:nucleoside-diphosphate-sugar epimerase